MHDLTATTAQSRAGSTEPLSGIAVVAGTIIIIRPSAGGVRD
jgi:hypothetical protein